MSLWNLMKMFSEPSWWPRWDPWSPPPPPLRPQLLRPRRQTSQRGWASWAKVFECHVMVHCSVYQQKRVKHENWAFQNKPFSKDTETLRAICTLSFDYLKTSCPLFFANLCQRNTTARPCICNGLHQNLLEIFIKKTTSVCTSNNHTNNISFLIPSSFFPFERIGRSGGSSPMGAPCSALQ